MLTSARISVKSVPRYPSFFPSYLGLGLVLRSRLIRSRNISSLGRRTRASQKVSFLRRSSLIPGSCESIGMERGQDWSSLSQLQRARGLARRKWRHGDNSDKFGSEIYSSFPTRISWIHSLQISGFPRGSAAYPRSGPTG